MLNDGIYYFDNGAVMLFSSESDRVTYINARLDFISFLTWKEANLELDNEKVIEFEPAHKIIKEARTGDRQGLLREFKKELTDSQYSKKKRDSKKAALN
jgi:hypothetical protein